MTITHSMMDAMKPTVELPPCQRRWIDGDQIICKIPPRPPGMTSKEYLKFRRRNVSCADCLSCTEVVTPLIVVDMPRISDPAVEKRPEEPVDDRQPRVADILSDGSIVYPKDEDPPECPPGYVMGEDAWTFKREVPFCKHIVLKKTRKQSCECIKVVLYCTRNGKSEVVTDLGCETCPNHSRNDKPVEEPIPKIVIPEMTPSQQTHKRPRLLANGIIAYPMKGWEPPAVPNGYRRKSTDLRSADAWVFIPTIEPCKHRKREIEYTPCGNAKVSFTCDKPGCRAYGSGVVTYCNTCEERDV